MELTIRDWMVIVGVVLIVAVLLDAWRRVKAEKNARVSVNLAEPEEDQSQTDADLAWLKELPNGGARVVDRGDLLRAAAGHAAETSAVDDDVELVEGFGSGDQRDNAPARATAENAGSDGSVGSIDSSANRSGPATQEQGVTAGALPREPDPEVFMLNVVARDPAGFRGEDILHILLACDLRFGDMNFFHRHEFEAGRGAIQFSVANMMQPGVFDIDNMSELQTPGLVFFVTLPGPEDMMKAYDYMIETAEAVARNLGGDVLDESRSVLTRQAREHSRQVIRELEQRMLAKAR